MRKIYKSGNIFSGLSKIAMLPIFMVPVFCIAQDNFKQVAKNLKKQEMEVKNGNFTSFPQMHENLPAWSKFNRSVSHPEFGKLPFNAEFPGFVEVLEKRQIDERYFVNEQNPTEFHIQKAMGALHYRVNNQWLTIDHHITDKGNGIYEANQQSDPVGFDVNKALSYIKTPEGIVHFNNWKLFGTDNTGAEKLIASASWVNYTAGEDGIYVTDIFPGIDARMQAYRGSVKTDFIVRKLNYTTYTDLLFKDEFLTSSPAQLKFKGEAVSSRHAVSRVTLMSEKTPLVEIDEAIAYPQGGSKDQKITAEYFLEGNTLVTKVAVNWIQQYIGHTHVIIDPLVTSSNSLAQASITGSMYNASCLFTTSCNYNVSVNTPANATITDIQWSFVYLAQGICFLQDGACTFTLGGCLSPSGAGFYWYCNAPNPGTCTGTNISVFTDLGPCLPAPSCAPQALNFGMQFYRDCFGNFGCDGTCIGANSPWTMTLVGHTVEFTNIASPFTVSANTICFGQNITASTSAQYGVGPYNINWSFSPTGIPSVGSGTNPTINFLSPGTYTLYCIVTDACNQTTTSNQVITVNPLPTVTANASTNPICAGQNTILTGGGATTYTWSANAGSATTSTVSVSPASATTYTVSGTQLGCTNTATITVNVNPLPTLTVTASPVSVCSGQSSTLTATGATTYTWSPNAGSATTSTVSVNPIANTTYTVTGTTANCSSSQTITVNIIPPPTLTVSATTPSICAGAGDTLSVSGATSYTWSANAGNATTATVSVNPPGSATYTVTGNSGGCISTQTITVNVSPNPTVSIVANPPGICTGQSTTLSGSGATSYTWSANAGSATTSTVSVSPVINTTYTLTGTQGTCRGTSTVTINVSPQPTVTATASPTLICSGQTTTLTATGATNYTWMPGGLLNGTVTVSPNTTTIYTVSGSNGGCSSSQTVAVNVNATPTVTANANPASICTSQSATLTAAGATTYTWNPGGANTTTLSVSPGTTTIYTVSGTNTGCTASQTVTVNVTPTPTVSIIATLNPICSGQSTTLIGGGAISYTWSANAGSATTSTVSVSPSVTTTYTVTGANGNCSGTQTISITVNTTPTVTATSSSPALCAGQTTTLTAAGAGSFTWSPGGQTTATLSATPGTTTIYTVTGSNAGCSSTGTVSVIVNPLPILSPITGQTVCAGNNVNGITYVVNPNTATVVWSNTNPAIGVPANGTGNISSYPAPNVITQQAGIITATPTDPGTGCVGNPQSYTITINPSPKINGNAIRDTAFCGKPVGDVKGLSASGGTPGYTYQWYSGNTLLTTQTTATLTNVPSGSYSLVVTDVNGCKATAGTFSVVGTAPVLASFTATPNSGSAPLPVSFTSQTAASNTFHWNFGNGSNSTLANPSTNYTSAGIYIVTLIVSNGPCADTIKETVIVDQSIQVIVPNVFSPNGDNINDEFFIVTSGVTSLSCDIFNRWGQKVKTLSAPTQKWDGNLDNGHKATEGTYYYVLMASSYDGKSHNSQGSITLVR